MKLCNVFEDAREKRNRIPKEIIVSKGDIIEDISNRLVFLVVEREEGVLMYVNSSGDLLWGCELGIPLNSESTMSNGRIYIKLDASKWRLL